jgi:hypothetical protein
MNKQVKDVSILPPQGPQYSSKKAWKAGAIRRFSRQMAPAGRFAYDNLQRNLLMACGFLLRD